MQDGDDLHSRRNEDENFNQKGQIDWELVIIFFCMLFLIPTTIFKIIEICMVIYRIKN